jgi:hypothetical protein
MRPFPAHVLIDANIDFSENGLSMMHIVCSGTREGELGFWA